MKQLECLARENGFDRAYLLPIPAFVQWRARATSPVYPHWEKVLSALDGIPENARSVLLLVRAYRPYRVIPGEATISAYYVASNAAYFGAHALIQGLLKLCVDARASNLPAKQLVSGFGIGTYGRNGLCAIPPFGTRFVLETVLTDLPPEVEMCAWQEDAGFSPACANCTACMSGCPSAALNGSSRVDMEVCLRARARNLSPAPPDASKREIGNCIWGCEFCQDVCPRNQKITPVDMPAAVREAIALERLLQGEVDALAGWIGTNCASKGRMRARACIVAGNLRRADLRSEILPLLGDPESGVRECARWALDQIRESG